MFQRQSSLHAYVYHTTSSTGLHITSFGSAPGSAIDLDVAVETGPRRDDFGVERVRAGAQRGDRVDGV